MLPKVDNKTPPLKQERNKESCERSDRILEVPVVVEPIVVPVPRTVVPVEIADVEVVVRVAVMYKKPSSPLPFECSRGCIVFGILMP